jgi:catechol-2,3-dioxygenase
VLYENPQAKRVRGTSGLYHFAVLIPSRAELVKSLKRLVETQWPVQGFADHLGLNTWAGVGAPPPPDAIGLRYFTVQLPRPNEVGVIADRVRGNGGSIEETESGVLLRDPFQNGIVLTTQSPGS